MLIKPKFFVYLSIVTLLVSLNYAFTAFKLTHNSERANAVIKTAVYTPLSKSGNYQVTFEFTDSRGKVHIAGPIFTYRVDIAPEQEVQIIYDKANPSRVDFADSKLWSKVLQFFYGTLLLLGTAALRYWLGES